MAKLIAALALFALIASTTAQAGSWKNVTNFNESQIQSYCSFAQKQSGLLGEWELSQIVSVQSQLVNGMNYKIQAVYSSPFLLLGSRPEKTVEYVVYVPRNQKLSLTSATILAPSTQLHSLPSWTPVPLTALNTQKFTQLANLGEVASNINSEGSFKFVQINSVQEQLVNGWNYQIDAEYVGTYGLGHSQVTKNILYTVYQPIKGNAQLTSAQVLLKSSAVAEKTLFDNPLEKPDQEFPDYEGWNPAALDSDLEHGNQQLKQVGNYQDTTETPEVDDLINFAMAEFTAPGGLLANDSEEEESTLYSINQIISIQKQIVNGVNYRITIQVQATSGRTSNVQFVVHVPTGTNPTPVLTSQKILLLNNSKGFLNL